jgi:putative addiction module component (TIGR02574 family)
MSINELKRLSKSEKLLLVEELWDSIAEDTQLPPLSRSQKKLLNERLEQAKNSTERLTWNEIKNEVTHQ